MIFDKPVPTPAEFLTHNGLIWLLTIGVLIVAATAVSFLTTLVRYGNFSKGYQAFIQGIGAVFEDFFFLSWKRVWAIARLAVKESLRRRVLFIFAVFLVILMFAGWFLDRNAVDPTGIYLAFVLSMSTYLILLLALFLSAFSLPNDIKNKTIYTIVTKPVRSSEIVLGRILGFAIVGTALLCCMAVLSYFFVSFQLQHTHILTEKDLVAQKYTPEEQTEFQNSGKLYVTHTGTTRVANGHRHNLTVFSDGSIQIESANGHTHEASAKSADSNPASDVAGSARTRYAISPSKDILQARVPRYAVSPMIFRDDQGIDRLKGIDTGHEWNARGGIGSFTGSTNVAGIWTFENIRPERFPDGIPIEMKLGVYRTYKGDMEKRIRASISVRNPKTGLSIEALIFPTDEFITKSALIPLEFHDVAAKIEQRNGIDENNPAGAHLVTPEKKDESLTLKRDFNLFEDFVADGKVEIWLRCLDEQQFVEASLYDLYLRESDAPVVPNFFKGYFGIWMQMILVISFGVLLSTFLGGPVAMVSLFGVIIAGFSKSLLMDIAFGKNLGGGAFESLIRMLTQSNLMVDMNKSWGTAFVIMLDKISGGLLVVMGQIIPPFSDFAYYEQALQKGFNVPLSWMFVHGLATFGYVLPIFVVGYIILKNREVAK
ncbi:MAG: hypothetical protein LBT05_08820 [Planctomycetaceae bacterium]|jgi:hypothetical protein|nr:hypothetical protein [Planctomycetaceae bacterium]